MTMTLGSAACLPGPGPQAPLSLFRTPALKVVHPQSGDAAPPRTVSLQKAAGDPPGRPVLIVEDDAVAALQLQQRLLECGCEVVGPAASLDEAQRLIDRGARPVRCALIGACLPGAAAIADALGERGIGVVWIASGTGDGFAWDRRDEPVLGSTFRRTELRDAIERSIAKAGNRRLYVTPPPQAVWPRVFPSL
jgi:hypothetical protein